MEARGCANAIHHYGNDARWDTVEMWGHRLAALTERLVPGIPTDVPYWQIGGIVNAVGHYGAADRFADLERWAERIAAPRSTDPDNVDLAYVEASCCVNAMSEYGRASRFGDLERWGESLRVITQDLRFARSPNIGKQEAMGAVAAVRSYNNAGLGNSGKAVGWKGRLALVAQRFLTDPDIQMHAKDYSLSPLDQKKRGYPFGTVSSVLQESGLSIPRSKRH